MIGLAVRGDLAVLHFDEVADVNVFGQHCAGAQPRVRPDLADGTDFGVLDVAERLDVGAIADARVADYAVWTDGDVVSQFDRTFEYAIDVDRHVASAEQFAAHVDAHRIHQRHALFEQAAGGLLLQHALEFGQLQLAVDAQRLAHVLRLGRRDAHAVAHGAGHDVGQIVFALRIVVR